MEKSLAGNARVIRLGVMSRTGMALARRYGVRGVPAFVVLDKKGNAVMNQTGFPNKTKLYQTAMALGTRATTRSAG